MWPYNHDEQIWLEPSKDWAKGRLQPTPLPPANDDQRPEDARPIDPQIFISK